MATETKVRRHETTATPIALSAFTPSPSCSSLFYSVVGSSSSYITSGISSGQHVTNTSTYLFGGGVTGIDGGQTIVFGDGGWFDGNLKVDPNCYPTGIKSVLDGFAYFSPGACPQYYTQASSGGYDGGQSAVCCPQGYSFVPNTDFHYVPYCEATVSALSLANGDPTTFTNGTGTVTAVGLGVEWHDVQVDSHGNVKTGLSAGAKAGIGVGAAIVAIAGALLLYWLLWRRRKARRAHGAAGDATPEEAELPAEEEKTAVRTADVELDGTGRPGVAELPAERGLPAAQELETDKRPLPAVTELEGPASEITTPTAPLEKDNDATTFTLHDNEGRTAARSPTRTGDGKRRAELDISDKTDPSPAELAAVSPLSAATTAHMPVTAGQQHLSSGSPTEPPSEYPDTAASTPAESDSRQKLQAELARIKEERSRLRMEQLERREREVQEELERLAG